MTDMTTHLPPLPPIASTQLRKRVFTHASVFRLQPHELEQIENVDNDRLSFLGRATIDYALSSIPTSTPSSNINLDKNLASCAETYNIINSLHRTWREPISGSSNPPIGPPPPTQAQATQLMEAYIGALVLESESDGMQFATDLVRRMVGLISEREETGLDTEAGGSPDRPRQESRAIVPEPQRASVNSNPPLPSTSATLGPGPGPGTTTGQLHDLATQRGLVLSWDDHAQGPKHAQEWTSDVTLRDHKTNRTWPSIARGTGKSKKLARADAAAKVLSQWNTI
ncbi:hypothetical protein FRC09_014534 [Ceratobasidium sp. 395]|nr:hypothetical protein FRC09_014534 [Ceratobasidium sp. 395]